MTTTLATSPTPQALRAEQVPRVDDELLPVLAERGLRDYVAQVAVSVGAGSEAAWCEWADAPSAYIALEARLPGYPGRDVALIWAAERGWAVAVETGCGEDLLVTDSLSSGVLPAPATVAAWWHAVRFGGDVSAPGRSASVSAADLVGRLASWGVDQSTFDGWTG